MQTTSSIGDATSSDNRGSKKINYRPWMQERLAPLVVETPEINGLSILQLVLKSGSGEVLHRNFVHIVTEGAKEPEGVAVVSVAARDYSDSQWSGKTWGAMDSMKVNGAGKGYFEYTFSVEHIDVANTKEVYFVIEASAKELFVKDQQQYDSNQDFMKGSQVAPSSNPNSYPMTDEELFPSTVKVFINGQESHQQVLPDDPADHRGVLSWHSQPEDKKLREAGSYGYLIKIPIDINTLQNDAKTVKVRLETTGDGGLAIYGKHFGRYPLDPSLVVMY